MAGIQAFGQSVTCSDVIPKDRELAVIENNASLNAVLAELSRLRVHSLPVADPETKAIEGMVDVLDIVCSIYEIANLDRFQKNGHFNAGDVAAAFIDTKPLQEELSTITAARMVQKGAPPRGELIRDQPASFGGPIEPTAFVSGSDSLFAVIEKLGRDRRHRVPVMDEKGSFASIVTQSDLCAFLNANVAQLPESVLSKPLVELATKGVVKTHLNSSMAEALNLFRAKKVLSLAVEDRNGKFVGALSAHSFIRSAQDLSIYGMAVDEFFAANPSEAVLLPPTTTVAEGLKFIAEKRQARMWLGEAGHVSGIVSMRDILRIVYDAMKQK